MIPIVQEVSLTVERLLHTLLRLHPSRRLSLLDSCGARGAEEARFLIAGFDPFEIIEARGDEISFITRGANTAMKLRGCVLDVLDERLKNHRVAPLADFALPATGACIATFSYDFARRFLPVHLKERKPQALEPDAALAFYDTLIIHDYVRQETKLVGVAGAERLKEIEAELCSTPSSETSLQPTPESNGAAQSNFTRDEYLAVIERIKRHIAAGDIYQANLTQQLTVALNADTAPEDVFLRLRQNHPASFAAFIRRRDDTVISASPERFLHVAFDESARIIEAWPIKGTRPRGHDVEEDSQLRDELLHSAKDRAENVMIVDLLRNDLGRVCEYGSIEVPLLCQLQTHPTLFHLVSKVRGRLRAEVTAGDLLRAAFPCGSITGAPKLRAMEIIDAVETAPRGLSMGALGYFSFDGRLDLNVAIRTMTLREGTARFNVGGGIVADSDAALEYEESLVKARALLNALESV
jgi:para-aminobenzoate synthetase component 1